MAPLKTTVVGALLVLLLGVLVSGGHQAQQPAPAPAPLLIRGSDDAEHGSLARGTTNVVVGDGYVGCLEMRLSHCFADPTLVCVEDALVECGLQEAAAAPAPAPAATTTGAASGGEAASAILGALGGMILHGVKTAGAMYIACLEVGLSQCYQLDRTTDCVEKAIGAPC